VTVRGTRVAYTLELSQLLVGRYVPDSSGRRALIFILLFVYHGAHSLSKMYAMALLAQVSWLALIVYTVADHLAFQLLKLACNDYIYWMPGGGGMVSSISRFVAKVVADFTGTFCFLDTHRDRDPTIGCVLRWQDWCIVGIRASSEAPTTFLPPS
jgi:hypothetical protein